MTYGHIKHVKTEDLGLVLKSLMQNGICFSTTENSDGTWNVEVTGY